MRSLRVKGVLFFEVQGVRALEFRGLGSVFRA